MFDPWALQHVLSHVVVKFIFVRLTCHLSPIRLFNDNFQLSRCFAHVPINLVRNLEVPLLVHNYPSVLEQVDRSCNCLSSQSAFVANNDLALINHLRSSKNICLHLDRTLFDYKVPVFQSFLRHQSLHHLLNASGLFSWVNSCLS